jgi:hypothetical protein
VTACAATRTAFDVNPTTATAAAGATFRAEPTALNPADAVTDGVATFRTTAVELAPNTLTAPKTVVTRATFTADTAGAIPSSATAVSARTSANDDWTTGGGTQNDGPVGPEIGPEKRGGA